MGASSYNFDMSANPSRYILLGQLRRDSLILPDGKPRLDVPGGNALYAAAGLMVWEPQARPGIVARVGEEYPREWLNGIEARGVDIQGVQVQPHAVDVRAFAAYPSRYVRSLEDPVRHFARLELPFPRELLGYRGQAPALDSRTQLSPTSLRQGDLPLTYLEASAAHLCPVDYLTHSLLPAVLRQAEFTTVTLDPSPGYMNPTYWHDVAALVTGLTAFTPSEEEVCSLFQGRSDDLWEMAAALAAYGCEIIIIKRGEGGQMLYDAAARRRWEISAYPSRVVDPTGVGDAFCGGFLAGYRRTYDPLEAVLYGNIAASLVIEGAGPFYALDALPGLAEARLEALRQTVRQI